MNKKGKITEAKVRIKLKKKQNKKNTRSYTFHNATISIIPVAVW